ncbi:MAG TPA: formate dehydrogenase [Anaerolineae bacterium]|nr:formate dehydrogenase [Anaerolineae bacterium]
MSVAAYQEFAVEVAEGDTLGALQGFLGRLLAEDIVDALLVPQRLPAGDNVVPTLIRDPNKLAGVDPIAPVMPVAAATALSKVTATKHGERLAAVLRSCELRAVIELVKLQQASLDDVILVGIDCLGTYEVTDYARLIEAGVDPTAELLAVAAGGQPAAHEGYQFRAACRMCEKPVPGGPDVYRPDITIGLLGLDPSKQILIEVSDDLAEKLGLEAAESPARRKEVTERLIAERTAERDRVFAAFRERVAGVDSLLAEFSTCIRCYNCMGACPLCYCKECIFRTPTFDHASPQYFRWAERKGAIRLPTDTLLFHLTRLNHMSTSCVGCGLCESACPSELPVALVFRAVGQETQAIFDYHPGRSLEEEVPVATFREDELTDLGEAPR